MLRWHFQGLDEPPRFSSTRFSGTIMSGATKAVFISYAREDLAAALAAFEVEVWFD